MHYIDVMSQSNVFNYAIQLFQGLNSPARLTFGIQFSQGFHITVALRVDKNVEALELKTFQTMIVNKEAINQQDSEYDQARFKSEWDGNSAITSTRECRTDSCQ